MNVLVYSGPGTTAESVKHCLESLRLHLSPYYAVVAISESTLLNDPWMNKTSLLVMPGGADLPYCKTLNGLGNTRIKSFVKKGGKFIGFCAGAYYASAKIQFEAGTPMEVSGSRELAFFPGTKVGCAYSGFEYENHEGARATPLKVNTAALPDCPATIFNYYNGGGVFLNTKSYKDVEVLAEYTEPLSIDTNGDMAAAIYRKYGNGDVLLTGTHPEFASTLMKPTINETNFKNVVLVLLEATAELNRKKFLRNCLSKIGLRTNEDIEVTVPKLTTIYLSSILPNKTTELVKDLKDNLDFVNGNTLEDKNDTLVFHGSQERWLHEESEDQDPANAPKHIQIFENGEVPDRKITPYFDMDEYFKHLQYLYQKNGDGSVGAFGSVLGYGEVVTSTNTLMDANPGWVRHLPHGFTLLATTQVAGRGRGGNVWINPKGVMALSILFKVPGGANQASSIVTLQYLAVLAIVESILSYGSDTPGQGAGYENMPVKLKWPNDIYILKPEYLNSMKDLEDAGSVVDGEDQKYVKMSGSLINSQFLNGEFHLVLGCGINVSNSAPTTSLNIVLEKLNAIRVHQGLQPLPAYRQEQLLAGFMFMLDRFYSVFKTSGLGPFLPLYYKRWFHTSQQVSVDLDGNGTTKKCVVKGITPEYGMLVVEEVGTKKNYDLQPDGNSFDMFKGLVYRKS